MFTQGCKLVSRLVCPPLVYPSRSRNMFSTLKQSQGTTLSLNFHMRYTTLILACRLNHTFELGTYAFHQSILTFQPFPLVYTPPSTWPSQSSPICLILVPATLIPLSLLNVPVFFFFTKRVDPNQSVAKRSLSKFSVLNTVSMNNFPASVSQEFGSILVEL